MRYTYKSLTLVWLLIFGLYALTGSGVVAGSWVLLLVVAALGVPLLLTLRGRGQRARELQSRQLEQPPPVK